MIRKYAFLFIVLIPIIFISCTTDSSAPPIYSGAPAPVASLQELPGLRQDIKHVVAPGETLWRISKMYDVPASEIARANQLKKPSALLTGQSLLIPKASALRSVIPLYPNSQWKFIIIHHSATDEGNSLSFNRHHIQRGFGGVGYHFVIDNGTSSKIDGQIEVAPRWIKQQNGAHCKASEMNCRAIGICLVGNFNVEQVSNEQMNALVFLVNTLRNYYKIPIENIMGHGQVPGANTECPGKRFPWQKFKSVLSASSR